MSQDEYVIDGNELNVKLATYNFEAVQPTMQFHHLLPGQVFEVLEKKFIPEISQDIEKKGAKTVRFVNLEALATGAHKNYLYPICSGLSLLIEQLEAKKIKITGSIQNPWLLTWELAAKVDEKFKAMLLGKSSEPSQASSPAPA